MSWVILGFFFCFKASNSLNRYIITWRAFLVELNLNKCLCQTRSEVLIQELGIFLLIIFPSYHFGLGLVHLEWWSLLLGFEPWWDSFPDTRQLDFWFGLICVFSCTWHPGVCWSGHLICHLRGLYSWPWEVKIKMSCRPPSEPQNQLPAPDLLTHWDKLAAFIWNRKMGLVWVF